MINLIPYLLKLLIFLKYQPYKIQQFLIIMVVFLFAQIKKEFIFREDEGKFVQESGMSALVRDIRPCPDVRLRTKSVLEVRPRTNIVREIHLCPELLSQEIIVIIWKNIFQRKALYFNLLFFISILKGMNYNLKKFAIFK